MEAMVRHGLLAFVLLLGAARAEEFEDHDKAHGRPELARVGTIGDRPPPESTLVVHVHADGAIVVEGEALTLRELAGALAEFRDEKAEPSVLLRADARLPWVAWARVLETCAEQKLRRIFHAVLPEAGEEEGAFFWPLPPDSPSAEGTGSTLPLALDFPLDPWGDEGGRVYSTALMTMCLEVYYRYDRR